MSDLLQLIRDLCLRRIGPQDLPYSPRLLLISLGVYLLIDLVISSLLGDAGTALAPFLLVTSSGLIALNIILSLRELRGRFVQTALALVACDIVFSLVMLPFQVALKSVGGTPASAQDINPAQGIIAWIAIAIFIWKLMIDANIFRHALNLQKLASYVVTILWLLFQGLLLIGIFGEQL